MQRNHRMTWMAAVLGTVALTGMVGCTKGKDANVGSASVSVGTQKLTTGDVKAVTVTISGGISTPLTVPLVGSGNKYSGLVSDLPVGGNYVFTGLAKDSGGATIYSGSANVTIVKNQTASVIIDMNQVAPGVALENEAPVIDSLTASSLLVSSGDTVNINASAHDPDAGQTAAMSFGWDSTCGPTTLSNVHTVPGTDDGKNPPLTFTDGTSSVVFTAPAAGPCTVNLTVTDANGVLKNVASLTIQINNAVATGNANITAYLDTYPEIHGMTADPVPLVKGQATTLSVNATDSDGDTLNYLWTSPDCGSDGTFATPDPTAPQTVQFTLKSTATESSCIFLVRVDDGNYPDSTPTNPKPKGGVITNHLSLPVSGPGNTVVGGPLFGYDYQSQSTISGGDVVGMAIVATQGCSGPLTLSWSTTDSVATDLATVAPSVLGLDGTVFTTAAQYTAPAGAEDGPVVKVFVTALCSASGLSTQHEFDLVGASSVCIALGDGADCTKPAQTSNVCVLAASCLGGQCVPTSINNCSANPGTTCTPNRCDPTLGCIAHPLTNGNCDDGDPCTTGDTCQLGVCVGTAKCQAPSNVCQTNTCQAGSCVSGNAGTTVTCDDGNACTGVVSNFDPKNPLVPGTSTDHCDGNGACAGPAVVCPSLDTCKQGVDDTHFTCPVAVCMDPSYDDLLVPPLAGLAIEPFRATPWITGSIYTPYDFGSGLSSSSGGADMYLAKLNPATGKAAATYIFGNPGAAGTVACTVANAATVCKTDPACAGGCTCVNGLCMGATNTNQSGGGVAVAPVPTTPTTGWHGYVAVYGSFAGEIDFTGNSSTYPVNPDTGSAVGVAGIDYLAGSGSFFALFDPNSPSPGSFYPTPILAHAVNLGTGTFLSIASNPHVNAFAICGKTNGSVPRYYNLGTNSGLITGSAGAFGGGNFDLVVAKIDASDGHVIWGKQLGAGGDQVCESVALDNSGNVLIAGNYSGSFKPGINLASLPDVSDTSGATAQLFLMQLAAADGSVQWALGFPSTSGFRNDAYALTVDGNGCPIMGGANASHVDFGNTKSAECTGLTDAFVAKFNAPDPTHPTVAPLASWVYTDGDPVGSTTFYDQTVYGLAVSSANDVVISGSYKGALPLLNLTDPANSSTDAFDAKLSGTDGTLKCSHEYGDASGGQSISTIAVAAQSTSNTDAIFMGGSFQSSITLGNTTPLVSTGNTPCIVSADCPVAMPVCVNNICAKPCTVTADCSSGSTCVNNLCTSGAGVTFVARATM